MTDDDTTDRLDRLESLVERQAAAIEALREDVAALGGDRDDGGGRDAPVSRRTALKAGGLLALLGIGAGTASADPQGQVGTASDPLHALYSLEANSPSSLSVSTGGQRVLDLGVPGTDGDGNTAGGNVVAGHPTNVVRDGAVGAAIGGGGGDDPAGFNRVYDHYGTVTGGEGNQAGSDDADPSTATHAVAGGGFGNVANGPWSVVSGGQLSQASGESATVGGGNGNAASGTESTAAGGQFNEASATHATVGGGFGNTVGGTDATVGGGRDNTASGNSSTVGGGRKNTASTFASTVGGGQENQTNGNYATVGGGLGNTASGEPATVPGGLNNTASGDYSFAAGRKATASHDGAVVFGDSNVTEIQSQNPDEFRSQMPMYAPSFNTTSARAAKTAVEPVDPEAVLDRVEALDVSTWGFRDEDDGRHMGPMAGEFHDAFGLGGDTDSIATVDADGVALAAIQGLAQKLDEKDERIDDLANDTEDLRSENDRLRERNAELEARLDRVEAHLGLDADSQRWVADD